MRTSPEHHTASTKRRVLFVDDDPSLLAGLETALRMDLARWDVRFVLGGQAAIAALCAEQFDVLVTDLSMPEVDGLDVLKAAADYSPRTLRILLTGSPVDVLAVDVVAIVTKPVNVDGLRALLEHLARDHTTAR